MKRSLVPSESAVLAACLGLLAVHPKVAWARRMNVGGMVDKRGQFVKFGFKGMADITGQLKDGRRLEVEVKKPGKTPTPDQLAFLYRVNKDNGVGLWVSAADKLHELLRQA